MARQKPSTCPPVKKHIDIFDQALHSTLTIVAIILFVICLSLVVLGIKDLVEGWMVLTGYTETILGEDASALMISGMGMVVIGIAVLDLIKSILEEEIAERKFKNVQERARDFLTRFLPVIIFAIAAEIFVTMAQIKAIPDSSGIIFDMAIMGIAVGAMLVGLGFYIRMTSNHNDKKEKKSFSSSLGGLRDSEETSQ